jgi:hypothetical protein
MNPYNTAAYNFSLAYQMQTAAADAQRRANQASDTAFADIDADNETSLRGQPQPQAPTAPNTNLNGFSETNLTENTNRDLQTLMRAKRRVSKYLSQDEVV